MSLQAAVDLLGIAVNNLSSFKDKQKNNSNNNRDIIISNQNEADFDYSNVDVNILNFLDCIVKDHLQEILSISDALTKESIDNPKKNILKMIPNPPAPATLLSINHLRVIYTSIELLWVCGVLPYLKTKLDETFDFGDALHPKSVLLTKDTLTSLSNFEIIPNTCQILCYTRCMYNLLSNPVFSINMLPRNLRRVLVSLLVLAEEEKIPSQVSSIQSTAILLLEELCFRSSNKSFVISELRVAATGPPWMRLKASDLFLHIILSKGGIEAVLQAYLEGATDQSDSFPLQIKIVKLITSVPSMMRKEEYFSLLSPQIVELFHFSVDNKETILQKVCVLLITRISFLSPMTCITYLIRPIAKPLLHSHTEGDWDVRKEEVVVNDNVEYMIRTDDNQNNNNIDDKKKNPNILYDEKALVTTIYALHALVTLCPLQPYLVTALDNSGVGVAAMSVSAIAIQLEDIVINSSLIRYITIDKQLCVASKEKFKLKQKNSNIDIYDVSNKNIKNDNQRTAHNLVKYLGLAKDVTDVMSSPLQMLSEIKNENEKKSENKKNGSNDIEMSTENDLESIISMAVAGAETHEQQVAALISEDQMVPGSGHSMLEVTIKAKAVAELLILFKLKKEQIYQKNGNNANKEVEDDIETIISELFIRCLQSYLCIPSSSDNVVIILPSISEEEAFGASPPPPTPSAQSEIIESEQNDHDLKRGLSGLFLITLQSHVDMEDLLNGGSKILQVMQSFLWAQACYLDENALRSSVKTEVKNLLISANTEDDDDSENISDRNEMLSCVLEILQGIVTFGKIIRNANDEKILKSLLHPLQVIAFKEKDIELSQNALRMVNLLLTRSSIVYNNKDTDENSRLKEKDGHLNFSALLLHAVEEYFSSAEPHLRALGVHTVMTAINDSTEPLTSEDLKLAVSTFVTLLNDQDSYVYLSILNALTKLADLSRHLVFRTLLESFSGRTIDRNLLSPSTTTVVPSSFTAEIVPILPAKQRALLGEALSCILRRAGEAAPPLVPALVAACVRVVRVRPTSDDERSATGLVNLSTMKITKVDGEDGDDSSAEVEAGRQKRERDVSTAALVGDEALLRQSAMSLLAEAMVCAGYSASKYYMDILDIATGVLSMEGTGKGKGVSSQMSSNIRRSAAFLLRHSITGLGDKLLLTDDGSIYLKLAYRALKLSRECSDPVVAFHSDAALGQLDSMMRSQLFLP